MTTSPTSIAAWKLTRAQKEGLLAGCKVEIGSKYTGPRFDRPCVRSTNLGLRTHDWSIEESKPPKRISPDGWVLAAVFVAWVFCFVQTAIEMAAK